MNKIFLGTDHHNQAVELYTNMLNRHGLITGATGTGKTVTLKILAEQFSKQGIPVVLTDIKGDLSGLAAPGEENKIIKSRLDLMSIADFNYQSYPCLFWDVYAKTGLNLRTTVSEIGPLLLARILKLNDTQECLLLLAFKIADDEGLLLLDLKDLSSLLKWLETHKKELEPEYGSITSASIKTILRKLVVLEDAGATTFLGEPAIDIYDLMQTVNVNVNVNNTNYGLINILNATHLIQDKRLYTTCLLYLLTELYSNLDEVGDLEKPRLVFFFDEAHLLFNDAPEELLDKVEQVVRLIRSKGVGIFFISQNANDIPETILGQLGNRFQHALRAFTPKDQKAINAAANTFRQNPEFNTKEVITQLGVGEALVSVLDQNGMPTVVAKTLIRPPESAFKPIDNQRQQDIISHSKLFNKYSQSIDRHSAYEQLKATASKTTANKSDFDYKTNESKSHSKTTQKKTRTRQSVTESMIKSTARAIGSQLGRSIVRSIMGSLLK